MKIIDMHCDTLIECWRHEERTLRNGDGHLNLEMMKDTGAMAQFFAIYLSRNEMKTMDPYDIFKGIYKTYKEEMAKNTDIILPAYSAEDILTNNKNGKMSAFLTIEDGVFIDGNIDRIQEVYDMGVRLLTLIWGFSNTVGHPCSDNEQENMLGLTPFGLKVVEKMNALGMIIDTSHMSEGGFYDVAKYSKKPFVASHSCAKALCPHKRNLTDNQLKTLGDLGGVAGVNFESSFLKEGSKIATIEQIVQHTKYMVDKAGINSVGFGSDFDGIDSAGEIGCYRGYDAIICALEKEFTDDEIDKITHKNVLRVMKDIIGN